MIRRPDEYAHQNDSLAIVDESNVRGGRRVVQNLQELYGLYAYQDKLKDNVTIVRVISEDKDYRLIDKNNANNSVGWVVNSVSSPPEIQISTDQPTDSNIKLWGKTKLSDLSILKLIRNDNPDSLLTSIWNDSQDSQNWQGVTWDASNVRGLDLTDLKISDLSKINMLKNLEFIAANSTYNSSNRNTFTSLDISGLKKIWQVLVEGSLNNNLSEIFCPLSNFTMGDNLLSIQIVINNCSISNVDSIISNIQFVDKQSLFLRKNLIQQNKIDELVNLGVPIGSITPQRQ